MVKKWRAKWLKMSSAERLQVQVVSVLFLFTAYGLIIFQFSYRPYLQVEMMYERQMRQNATKLGKEVKSPTATPQTVKRQIEEVEKKLREIKEVFNELDTGFVPLNSSEMRQQLQLEVANLAQRTKVELQSIVTKTGGGNSAAEALDPDMGRPVLSLLARGQYQALIDFLHGLKELSFYVSPLQINVSAQPGKTMKKGPEDGSVYVSLELSM